MDQGAKVKKDSFAGKVRGLFDSIAPTYDLLNRINSFGLDEYWRRDLVDKVSREQPELVLDLAAGTCDLSIMLAEKCQDATVVASDLSLGMLEIGVRKAHARGVHQVKVAVEDAMDLSFEEGHFDAVTCTFGIRNFESIVRGYQEIYRVLRPGGMMAILELCQPVDPIEKLGFRIHAGFTIPLMGGLVSNNKEAYQYLYKSILLVPHRGQMERLMQMAGFINTYYKIYAPGVCGLYVGYKPKMPELEEIYNKVERIKRHG